MRLIERKVLKMKRGMTSRMCLLLAAFFLAGGEVVADQILSSSPATQIVTLSSPVSIGIRIEGLGNLIAPSLGVYDLTVFFDPTILLFSSVSFGDPALGDQLDLFGFGSITSFIAGVGSINLFELSLDSVDDLNDLQLSSFVLATVQFDTIGLGTSSVEILINALGDAMGSPLAATTQDASITVVPEPNLTPLLGLLGLAVCCFVRRSRFGRTDAARAKSASPSSFSNGVTFSR